MDLWSQGPWYGEKVTEGRLQSYNTLVPESLQSLEKKTYDPKTKSVTARTASRFDLTAASEAETRYCKKKVLQKLIW